MMILVVLAFLTAPLAAGAQVCGVAQCDAATYNSAAEPSAAESHDVMALSPGQLLRSALSRWFGPAANAGSIVKVTVRDEDSRIVHVIDSERDLAAFRALWAALAEAEPGPSAPPMGRPYYKLQIQYARRGGRIEHASWFYFPGGAVQLLAVMRSVLVAPLYRTPTPDAFEALLRSPA
jgi:hypothetical protein